MTLFLFYFVPGSSCLELIKLNRLTDESPYFRRLCAAKKVHNSIWLYLSRPLIPTNVQESNLNECPCFAMVSSKDFLPMDKTRCNKQLHSCRTFLTPVVTEDSRRLICTETWHKWNAPVPNWTFVKRMDSTGFSVRVKNWKRTSGPRQHWLILIMRAPLHVCLLLSVY